MEIQQYKALELDTANIVEGFYYMERGYYMSCGKPDLNRPTIRHYIVDYDGCHRDILETTLEPIQSQEAG